MDRKKSRQAHIKSAAAHKGRLRRVLLACTCAFAAVASIGLVGPAASAGTDTTRQDGNKLYQSSITKHDFKGTSADYWTGIGTEWVWNVDLGRYTLIKTSNIRRTYQNGNVRLVIDPNTKVSGDTKTLDISTTYAPAEHDKRTGAGTYPSLTALADSSQVVAVSQTMPPNWSYPNLPANRVDADAGTEAWSISGHAYRSFAWTNDAGRVNDYIDVRYLNSAGNFVWTRINMDTLYEDDPVAYDSLTEAVNAIVAMEADYRASVNSTLAGCPTTNGCGVPGIVETLIWRNIGRPGVSAAVSGAAMNLMADILNGRGDFTRLFTRVLRAPDRSFHTPAGGS